MPVFPPVAIYNRAVPELTPAHIAILEKLVSDGYAPVAFPLYGNAIGIRRGSFAALLVPDGDAALKMMGEPCYVMGLNLAVRARREGRAVFVWKDRVIEATAELLEEFRRFSVELAEVLGCAQKNPHP